MDKNEEVFSWECLCVHTCYVKSQAFIYLEKIKTSPLMDTEGGRRVDELGVQGLT